jgi:hypothetical protein
MELTAGALPPIRLHDLRHGAGTLSLAAEASVAAVPRRVAVGEASETVGLPTVSRLVDRRPTDSSAGATSQVE